MRRIALVAVAMTLLGAAEASARTYSGHTDQKRRISFRLSDDGQRFERFKIGWEADCRAPGYYYSSITVGRDEPLSRNGARFVSRAKYRYRESGELHTVSMRIAGTESGQRSYGTWRATVSIRKNGRVIDFCDSERVFWRTERRA